MEDKNLKLGEPVKLNKNYNYVVHYSFPGPLSCLSGIQSGCSAVVDAGSALGGTGMFCDYMVLCAGATVSIFYMEFRPVA